jgi:hypothetical protein
LCLKYDKERELMDNIILSSGPPCPKCKKPMETKTRTSPPSNCSTFYFSQWDYCLECRYIQHYEKYKVFPKTTIKVKSDDSDYPLDRIIGKVRGLLKELEDLRVQHKTEKDSQPAPIANSVVTDDDLPWTI